MATLGGGTVTCMGCGGSGWVNSSPPAPTSSIDPETTLSIISGATVAFLAHREGSVTSGEALGIATLVALLVRFTIAKHLVAILRIVIRLALFAGVVAAIAYCGSHP